PGDALAPVRKADPAAGRDIAETASLVVVERADPVAGEAEVGAAVIVIVTHPGADPVPRAIEAGGSGRVGEAFSLVVVEPAARGRRCRPRGASRRVRLDLTQQPQTGGVIARALQAGQHRPPRLDPEAALTVEPAHLEPRARIVVLQADLVEEHRSTLLEPVPA